MDDPTAAKKRRTVIWISVLLLVIAGVAILRRYDPRTSAWYPKCAMYQWTGLHCPGCGTTRALAALSRGNVGEAVRNNPMLILGGPVIFAFVWYQRRRERAGIAAIPRLAWTLFFVMLFYGIARNVPSPQRSWLAPPPVESESR